MAKPLHILLTTLISCHLLAQEKATTESGKKVLIFPNGKWTEDPQPLKKQSGLSYTKQAKSTSKITFLKNKASIYYDPSLWKLAKQEDPTKIQLQHRDGDGYVLIISERMQIPTNTLKDIALSNAKNVAPDSEIVQEETRLVNGNEVLHMQIRGTIQGIPFIYFGYYYTGKEGCIQMITYTTNNLFDEYKKDFTDFLNGFTIE
ncbi:MAG: hypothetical protein LWX11_09885 [Firmicutes bacterium]|nr:hypothetical protein [Bacillota bacterium]